MLKPEKKWKQVSLYGEWYTEYDKTEKNIESK